MIPNALKWVAAAVGIIVVVVVTVPLAVDAIFGTVEFTDDSGLFDSTPVDDPLPTPEPGELDEDGDGGEDDGGDEGEGDDGDDDGEDRETADDAEVATDDEDDDADDEADGGQTYTVEGGDTLYSIAEEVYGDGNRWGEIAEANGIDDQSGLTVGQELDIP